MRLDGGERGGGYEAYRIRHFTPTVYSLSIITMLQLHTLI